MVFGRVSKTDGSFMSFQKSATPMLMKSLEEAAPPVARVNVKSGNTLSLPDFADKHRAGPIFDEDIVFDAGVVRNIAVAYPCKGVQHSGIAHADARSTSSLLFGASWFIVNGALPC